jgi:glutamyl-Q tRNA(Asp) synthetase
LHFGSLVAAVASYLDAKAQRGKWLVRIEDLDSPRTMPGAASAILSALDTFGMHWDEEPVRQSERHKHYRLALERLAKSGMLYPCACSRQEIADSARAGDGTVRYPGTCRSGLKAGRSGRALRLRTDAEPIVFADAIQGVVQQVLEQDIGDFVLRRADGFIAYQLAVVVDDADQGITHVVRGADLLYSTPRQIYLQRLLQLPTPAYMHVPVVLNERGEKLSKQTGAPPLDLSQPLLQLVAALHFLGQEMPRGLERENLSNFWQWATAHWRPERIPRNPGTAIRQVPPTLEPDASGLAAQQR